MSKKRTSLLIDEPPLLLSKSLATILGINRALILQQLHFLISAAQTSKNEYVHLDTHWWVYNSYAEWRAAHFPWLSEVAIRKLFIDLEELKIVLSRQSVKYASDRRKWYTIDYTAFEVFSSDPMRYFLSHDTSDKKYPMMRQKVSHGLSESPLREKTPIAPQAARASGKWTVTLRPTELLAMSADERDAYVAWSFAQAALEDAPDIDPCECFACGHWIPDGIEGMRAHLASAHVITGGNPPIQSNHPEPSPILEVNPYLTRCLNCGEDVAIATVISIDGTHTRMCPACKTEWEFPDPDHVCPACDTPKSRHDPNCLISWEPLTEDEIAYAQTLSIDAPPLIGYRQARGILAGKVADEPAEVSIKRLRDSGINDGWLDPFISGINDVWLDPFIDNNAGDPPDIFGMTDYGTWAESAQHGQPAQRAIVRREGGASPGGFSASVTEAPVVTLVTESEAVESTANCDKMIEVETDDGKTPDPANKSNHIVLLDTPTVAAPDWFDRPHAAIIRAAMIDPRGVVKPTTRISGQYEGLQRLIEFGYLRPCKSRINAYELTEQGRGMRLHPLVVELAANAQATAMRVAERPVKTKSNRNGKKTVPAHVSEIYEAINSCFGGTESTLTKSDHNRRVGIALELADAGAGAAETRAVYDYCKAQNWPGGFTVNALAFWLQKTRDAKPAVNNQLRFAVEETISAVRGEYTPTPLDASEGVL